MEYKGTNNVLSRGKDLGISNEQKKYFFFQSITVQQFKPKFFSLRRLMSTADNIFNYLRFRSVHWSARIH